MGLYVTKPVKKKQPITAYATSNSKRYTAAQLERVAPGNQTIKYGLQANGRRYNAYQTNDWQGRYANEARGTAKQNAKIKATRDGAAITATKNIQASKNRPKQVLVKYNRAPKTKGKPKTARR